MTVPITTPVDENIQTVPIVDPVGANNYPSPEGARELSKTAEYGSKDVIDTTVDQLYNTILQGRENELRNYTASKVDADKAILKQQLLRDLAVKQGYPLSLEQLKFISDPTKDLNKKTDPDTVFELNYAKKFVQNLDKSAVNMDVSTVDESTAYRESLNLEDAKRVANIQSAQFDSAKELGEEYIAKMRYVDSRGARASAVLKDQSWMGWTWDMIKQVVPFYNETVNRGWSANVSSANPANILLGENMDAQAMDILKLPLPEFKAKFDEIMNYYEKHNPQLALGWLSAFKGMSTSERVLNDAFTPLELLGIGGAVKALGRAGKVSAEQVAATSKYIANRKTVKDIVKGAASPEPPATAAAEAAGDLAEAATQRIATDLTSAVTVPEPTAVPAVGANSFLGKAKAYVTSNFDVMRDAIAGGGGNLSNALAARLLQDVEAAKSILSEILADTSKIERIPLQNLTAEALKVVKDGTKASYTGIKNAILDVSDPWINRYTNTVHYDLKIGNFDGTLFSSEDTARNFAKQHGLKEIEVIPEQTVIKRVSTETDEELARLADDGGPLAENEFKVEQQGLGYYIRVSKPVDETDKIWRDLLVSTAEDRSIVWSDDKAKWFNGLFGSLRTPEDTLAAIENANRKVATYSPSNYFKYFRNEGKYIQDVMDGTKRYDELGIEIPGWMRVGMTTLNKLNVVKRIGKDEKYENFVRLIEHSQDAPDPLTKKPGYWFQTPYEIEQFYIQKGWGMPDFEIYRAYFATVRAYEFDRLLRNFSLYKNKSRVGAESHTIVLSDGQGNLLKSEPIEGVIRKTFSKNNDGIAFFDSLQNDAVAIIESTAKTKGKSKEPSQSTLKKVNSLGEAKDKLLRKRIEDGELTLIEIYDTRARPLNGFAGVGAERIKYVVVPTKNLETAPLDFNQINRRGGGHWDYDYNTYVKQANVTDNFGYKVYEGDNTFMPIANEVMGKDIAAKMNTVRELILNKDMKGARAYAKKELPMEWKTILGWFTDTKDESGRVIKARFNLNESFVVVPKGKTIFDMDRSLELKYGRDLKEVSKTGSLAEQYKVEFTQARDSEDMMTFVDVGEAGSPVYEYRPARKIDPLTMMNRGMTRIIYSSFMDDYKLYAVNHWLEEALKTGALRATKEEVYSSPFYYFNNVQYKEGVDQATKRILNLNHQKIKQFIGTPDEFKTYMQAASQKLADYMYSKYGPVENRGTVTRALTILPVEALARVQDPITFMRNMAFHYKLGLGNVAQFLVQAQSFTTMTAISPTHSLPGLYGSFLHNWARVNGSEAILDALDKQATKMRIPGFKPWKDGEWKEAHIELRKSGYGKVGSEVATKDDIYGDTFTQGDFRKLLDFGSFFFREGEQLVRSGSWYIAFREWREINPTKAITQADRISILNRADLLNNNMSRASNSIMHTGVFSLSTQFLSYQIRLAELFFGSRLGATTSERNLARARLVMFNAGMYGIPTSMGVTGLPLGDYFRQKADEHGYVVGDKFVSSLLMEGAPAMMLAMATGGGDYRKGTFFNIGDRYGIQGMTQIRDALRSDAPWWHLISGASGSILTNSWTAITDPWTNKMVSYINDDGKYPLKPDDFLDIFKEISSVNSAWKTFTAMNTGKWMTKNEGYITDTTKLGAIFRGLTGLSTQQEDLMYQRLAADKAIEAGQKAALKKFIEEYRRGIITEETNPTQAQAYYDRAFARITMAGFTATQRGSAIAMAMKGYESMVNQTNRDFALNKAPAKTTTFGITTDNNPRETRMDQFAREKELERLRNQ